jgi:hypothetical protein
MFKPDSFRARRRTRGETPRFFRNALKARSVSPFVFLSEEFFTATALKSFPPPSLA